MRTKGHNANCPFFGKRQEHLHYGIYKDVEDNRHDIVIREGWVGLWKDETIIH